MLDKQYLYSLLNWILRIKDLKKNDSSILSEKRCDLSSMLLAVLSLEFFINSLLPSWHGHMD